MVVPYDRVGAALLRTCHADSAARDLNGRRIDAHRIDPLRSIQPRSVRGYSYQIHVVPGLLQFHPHTETDLPGGVFHLRSLQNKNGSFLRHSVRFMEIQCIVHQRGAEAVPFYQVGKASLLRSLQKDDILLYAVSKYRVLIIYIRKYIAIAYGIVPHGSCPKEPLGRIQHKSMALRDNGYAGALSGLSRLFRKYDPIIICPVAVGGPLPSQHTEDRYGIFFQTIVYLLQVSVAVQISGSVVS